MTTMQSAETHRFQAETERLLDIVIHSLYTRKEIFLRELISNASDALDRLRLLSLTGSAAGDERAEPVIRLEVDEGQRTLTVHDGGVGMSREEVVANLGTIAKSGTRELVEQAAGVATGSALADLIGRFGVGFYSAFMVADRIRVVTRRAGEILATAWESEGASTFTVSDAERASHGTSVTLFLKPPDPENGIEDYVSPAVLQRIVKRHSDFVAYPILARVPRPGSGDAGSPDAGSPAPGVVLEEVRLNSGKPLWSRAQSEVSREEYHELYRHISHDWAEPARVVVVRAEGLQEYQALLFVPSRAPVLADPTGGWGLQLYSKRVMIMERCELLLPSYLRCVRGVVDSSDLPLNISREMLQQDRHITAIRRHLTRKLLDSLGEMARSEPEAYLKVWKELGRLLKEGVATDHENRERLVPLLRCQSSADPERLVSLEEAASRCRPGQDEIYYLTGESRRAIESSPHLEAFLAQGIEVLYLTDPIDELVVEWVGEVGGKRLRSVGKGQVELGEQEERRAAEERARARELELGDLLQDLKRRLGEHVSEVRVSRRLTSSPACLVTGEHDLSPQLQRMLQVAGAEAPHGKRILELNPDHEVVTGLAALLRRSPADPAMDDAAAVLLGTALLAEGSPLPDPARFSRAVAAVLERGLRGAASA